MGETIPMAFPALGYDFAHEASVAALNEACAYSKEPIECIPAKLCPDCANLAKQIEARLIRAFLAGQASMVMREVTNGE